MSGVLPSYCPLSAGELPSGLLCTHKNLIAVHLTGIFSSFFFSAALLAVMSVDLGSEFMKIAIVKVGCIFGF